MKKLLLFLISFIGVTSQAATINLAYPNAVSDRIWAYDGFGDLTVDCKAGAAIKITHDMYAQYIGAKITSLKVGWSTPEYTTKCTIFMRKNLTDVEDILTGSSTLSLQNYSNFQGDMCTVKFDNPDGLTLTDDLGDFYVGCIYEKIKKNTHPIASIGQQGYKGSAYLWRDIDGDNYDADGKQIWDDCNDIATLCMGLVVTGTFTNRVQMSNIINYPTEFPESAGDARVTLANRGTNSVSNITLEYQYGDQTKKETITLSPSLAAGTTKEVIIPIWALGSGDHQIALTKCGASNNYFSEPLTYQTIAVPQAVSKKYTRCPLVEFYESEDSYYVPKYYDEYFKPGYELYKNQCNLVAHHLDDQWMMDDDAGTIQMLQMCDNDSMQIYIPSLSVDRCANLPLYSANLDHAYPCHAVVLSDFANYLYGDALSRPTFASINVDSSIKDDVAYITVTGDVEEGILGNESLYVTVYVLEDDVYTDSQQQSDVEKGDYFHYNLQRARPTGIWGDKLDNNSGHFEMNYQVDLYPEEWDYDKMRVVVAVNQADAVQATTTNPAKKATTNNKWNRSVLNSASCPIKGTEGIDGVVLKKAPKAVFDLQGRAVSTTGKGLYIVDGKKKLLK